MAESAIDNHQGLITTLTNNRSITGGAGGAAGYGSSGNSTGSGFSAIDNYQGLITTLTNNGSITGGAGGAGGAGSSGGYGGNGGNAIDNYQGVITTLTNSGSITGGAGGAAGAGSSGSPDGSDGFGISNFGSIVTLNNAQGGGGLTPATTALTYTGALSTNYNIIINSTSHYGQIDFSDISELDTTTFGISALSGTNIGAPDTRYQNVITGLSANNITNELKTFTYTNGLLSATYQLVEDDDNVANTWDLLILSPTSGPPALNIITGTSGNDVINGTLGADKIYGMGGKDTLNGGAGADIMIGGDGSDTYVVDNAGDVVTEVKSQTQGGVDLVQVAISTAGGTYTLDRNLENATLTNTVAYSLTGNNLNNTLIGNGEVNTLNGGSGNDILNGGAGNDFLYGGFGNDTYVVDSTTDTITELFGFGTDLVQSSVTFSLANIAYVENLTLTGTSAINGTGNTLNNILTGNNGANKLNSGDGKDFLYGGLGNDTLTGGAGADHFVFNTALNGVSNKDTITDFVSGTDKIDLENSVMKALGLTTGTLASGQFWAGAGVVKGHDADDRIVYNTTTGALYYDADGWGSSAAIQIAMMGLSIHPTLRYEDFLII